MAKLRLEQLKKALQQELAPVYLIAGDEPLLVQEAADDLRKAARQKGFSEREVHHTDGGNFNWDQLLMSANSLSLFGDAKLIELRLHNGKPGTSGSQAIAQYCQAAPPDSLLLIVTPKLDKGTLNSAWVKAIDRIGCVITVWPVSAGQLPHWIDQRLKAAGLRADAQTIELLASKVEGNLLAAVQEIEKLKLLATHDVIDSQLMTAAVVDSARYDVFGLVDRALSGDGRAAARTLNGLRGEGTEPMAVLWALTREVRALYNVKYAVQDGRPFEMAAKQNGIWQQRQSLVGQAVKRLSLSQLGSLVQQAAKADRTVKGLSDGDAWAVLLDIVLGMAGTRTLPDKLQKLDTAMSYRL